MRKIISAILCMAVLLAAIPAAPAAAAASEDGGRTVSPEVQAVQLSQDIPQFRYMTFSQEPIGMSGEWLILPEHTVIYPAEGYKLAARGALHGGTPGSNSTYVPGFAEYGVGSEGKGMDYDIYAYPDTEDLGIDIDGWNWPALQDTLSVEHVRVLPADTWFYGIPSNYVPSSDIWTLKSGTARTTSWNLVSSWAVKDVETAGALGLTPPALKFSGDLQTNMERQQFAAVAVRLWEKLYGTDAPDAPEHPFTDLAPAALDPMAVFTDGLWDTWSEEEQGAWRYGCMTGEHDFYAGACAQAYALGLIRGISDTVFAPRDTLTREQAATILYRLLVRDGETLAGVSPLTFDDAGEISSWARAAVAVLTQMDIIHGVGGNRFAPQAPVTCQEALALAVRIIERQGNS